MNKVIIFWAIVIATVILAAIESVTIGLPAVNYPVITVCGVLLFLGLVYMKLSLYKFRHILWCLFGGLALTLFVTFGAHFANCLPVAIDYFGFGDLTILLLTIFTALYITAVYGLSLYFFVFYFCEFRGQIKDFK